MEIKYNAETGKYELWIDGEREGDYFTEEGAQEALQYHQWQRTGQPERKVIRLKGAR